MNNMEWYIISTITLLIYWLIGLIIYLISDDEDLAFYWALGLTYLLACAIVYPIRLFNKYKRNIEIYKKYNASYWDLLFGKVLYEDEVMWKWQAQKRKKEREKDE